MFLVSVAATDPIYSITNNLSTSTTITREWSRQLFVCSVRREWWREEDVQVNFNTPPNSIFEKRQPTISVSSRGWRKAKEKFKCARAGEEKEQIKSTSTIRIKVKFITLCDRITLARMLAASVCCGGCCWRQRVIQCWDTLRKMVQFNWVGASLIQRKTSPTCTPTTKIASCDLLNYLKR